MRRQKRSINSAINALKDQFPVVVKTIDCAKNVITLHSLPNSIYLWTNIKKHKLLNGSLEFIDSSIFMLNTSEYEFLTNIDTIFKEKESENLPKKRTNNIK